MKIGVTERGDAGLDYTWEKKLNSVDGVILITKNISSTFIQKVMQAHLEGKKIIVHCTCTGYGATPIEPNVPTFDKQLDGLGALINAGFPKENCVLRIDPIIPEKFERAGMVLNEALRRGLLPDMRVRISVLDCYPHVRQRFDALGLVLPMTGFQATEKQFKQIDDFLLNYHIRHGIIFESCAESNLHAAEKLGCVSNKDLNILGLDSVDMPVNPQNRNGCLCLCGKTELLTSREQCPHRCAYCYWKGNHN